MLQSILAYAFLVCLGLLLASVILVAFIRSPYTPTQSMLYFVDVLVTRLWWRATVPDRLPIPPGQGAVLVANHRSSVDPCFVQLPARRVVHWMVAADYFKSPLFGWLLRFTQSIPTRRSGIDTGATKEAVRLARQGEVVGIFPEGRINESDEFMISIRPGAALIALRAEVPMIPCYLNGSPYGGSVIGPLFMRARVRMRVGQPIDTRPYAGRENDRQAQIELICRCVREIAALAGHTDFEPQPAGRNWNREIPS